MQKHRVEYFHAKGKSESGTPANISQGKPPLFVWVKAEENALGCSVMQAPSNYLQPYREELAFGEISQQHTELKSSQINTLV